jgi:hypothetical protein
MCSSEGEILIWEIGDTDDSMLDHGCPVPELYFDLVRRAICPCLRGNSSRLRNVQVFRLQVRDRRLAWICMKNMTLLAGDHSRPYCVEGG